MPFATEVGRSQARPGHIVLDGDPASHGKGHSSPSFSADVYCGQTVTHLSNLLSSFFGTQSQSLSSKIIEATMAVSITPSGSLVFLIFYFFCPPVIVI